MRTGLQNRLTKAVVIALTVGLSGVMGLRNLSQRDGSQFVDNGFSGADPGFIIGFLVNLRLRNPWA